MQMPRDFVPDPGATPLPVLPFWQARSFWLTVLALLAMILPAFGVDWPWVSDPATVDRIMQIVGAVSAALAWRERLAPHFRLGLTRVLLLGLGLMLLLAAPGTATAEPLRRHFPIICHDQGGVAQLTGYYGALVPVLERPANIGGFGIALMEGRAHEVLVMLTPDGLVCVMWDTAKPGTPG